MRAPERLGQHRDRMSALDGIVALVEEPAGGGRQLQHTEVRTGHQLDIASFDRLRRPDSG